MAHAKTRRNAPMVLPAIVPMYALDGDEGESVNNETGMLISHPFRLRETNKEGGNDRDTRLLLHPRESRL